MNNFDLVRSTAARCDSRVRRSSSISVAYDYYTQLSPRGSVWLYLSVSVRVWPCLYTPLPPPSPAHTFCTFRAPLKRWLRPPYEKEETLARRLAKTRALPRCTDCATNVHVSSHETICRARRTDRMVTWPRTGRTHRRKTPFLNESAPEQCSVRIGALARARTVAIKKTQRADFDIPKSPTIHPNAPIRGSARLDCALEVEFTCPPGGAGWRAFG